MQDRKQSTRLWLLAIGILFAIGKEVLAYFEIQVSTETILSIEGMIIAVAGLDTVRPLGAGKTPASTEDPVEAEPSNK